MSKVTALRTTADEPQSTGLVPLAETGTLPISLRILLDEKLMAAAERTAERMANSKMAPAHLKGDADTCFSVVCDAVNSGLDPMFVARNTFPIEQWDAQTRERRVSGIGAMAALVRAKMEASGYFAWIHYEYVGDWSRVQNKWRTERNDRGKEVTRAAYSKDDEAGLAVVVRAQRKDRKEPDEHRIELSQCQPRNSILWATDPKTQATYVACRRYCSIHTPHVLGGMRFEDDFDPAELARDVTPTEERRRHTELPPPMVDLIDPHGEAFSLPAAEVAGWVRNQARGATDDELVAFAEINPGVPGVGTAVDEEMDRRLGTGPVVHKLHEPDPEPAKREPWVVRKADGGFLTSCVSLREAIRNYTAGKQGAADKGAFAAANLALLEAALPSAKGDLREKISREIDAARAVGEATNADADQPALEV